MVRVKAEEALERAFSESFNFLSRRFEQMERPDPVFSGEDAVIEAVESLLSGKQLPLEDTDHAIRLLAHKTRHILIDRARARSAQKRGGLQPSESLDSAVNVSLSSGLPLDSVIDVSSAVEDLSKMDHRAYTVVDMRFFWGYTDKEIATLLKISFSEVRRDWEFARDFIASRLGLRPPEKILSNNLQ